VTNPCQAAPVDPRSNANAYLQAIVDRGGQFVRSHNRQRDRALRLENEHRRTTDLAVLLPQINWLGLKRTENFRRY
jgi:hypothetical protein